MIPEPFEAMTDALRSELQEYGGMLGLLQEQQEAILRGEPGAFLDIGEALNAQIALVGVRRAHREEVVRAFAASAQQPASTSLANLVIYMPAAAAGMIRALIAEINALIDRTQRRLRQNHLLLARCVSAAQQAVSTAGGSETVSAYGPAGAVKFRMASAASHLAVA
jgi:hypothetical protein